MITEAEQKVVNRAKKILAREMMRQGTFNGASAGREYLKIHYAGAGHEIFTVIFLDSQHQVISVEDLSEGTIDGAAVYPREIIKRALQVNAAALCLSHNHPSGIAEPSQADIAITQKIKAAATVFDIRVLDHFIAGNDCITSLAERGLM